MPEFEDIQFKIEDVLNRLSKLESRDQDQAIQFIPKGVNWVLASPQSVDPGHTHTGTGISGKNTPTSSNAANKTVLTANGTGGTSFTVPDETYLTVAAGTAKKLLASNGVAAAPTYQTPDETYLTVTTGAAATVLTSNGAGSAPSYQAIPASGTRVSSSATQVAITNTSTETDMVNFSVPGGTLGTTGTLWTRIYIPAVGTTSGDTLLIKAYYGSSSIITNSLTIGAASNVGYIDLYLLANAATNSQTCILQPVFLKNLDSVGTITGITPFVYGNFSIDSTSPQTLRITGKWSGASNGDTLNTDGYFSMKIV